MRPNELETNYVNDGKRSIIINLKSDSGVKIFLKLIANADILIDPFRKGNRPLKFYRGIWRHLTF